VKPGQPLEKRQNFIRGRREKRKLARLARTRRQILRYTLLLVMVGAGICGFTYLPWTVNDLQDDVWIHGNNVVSDLQVRKAVSSALHQPLYQVDPGKLSKEICKLPAVRHAFVRRYIFPEPKVRVEIMEEFPWATYSASPEVAPEGVIAETGRFIPLNQFPKAVQPPLRLCGKKALKLNPGEIAQWDNWVRMIEAQTGQPVMLVDMNNPTAIQAYSGGFELHLGAVDSSLNRRIGRLSSVMPVLANLHEQLQYIDLSLDSNIPLKVDKSAKAGSTRPTGVWPAQAPVADGTQPPQDSATASPQPATEVGSSPLPTDHSAQPSTDPSMASTRSAPSF
jgi:hypothetical protein